MSQEQSTLMKALDYAYEKSINGLPGFDSARRMAETYQRSAGTPRDQANALIRWQVAKAGTSGFLAGLGGVLSMPVLLPANIATVMVVQVRMIAAIACLGGHDVGDDRVKSLVYVCLAGNSAKDVLKDVGVVVGTRLTRQMIQSLSGKTLTAINQKVGFRLLTKFGQTRRHQPGQGDSPRRRRHRRDLRRHRHPHRRPGGAGDLSGRCGGHAVPRACLMPTPLRSLP